MKSARSFSPFAFIMRPCSARSAEKHAAAATLLSSRAQFETRPPGRADHTAWSRQYDVTPKPGRFVYSMCCDGSVIFQIVDMLV